MWAFLLLIGVVGIPGTDDQVAKAKTPGPLMNNPGFEAADPTDGWEVITYGAKARVERDEKVVHEGRTSLRVSADEPSDTALGQDIDLSPNHWYRFTGWAKTRGLDPMNAPVSGTFQVQRGGGKGVLASGPSLRADTDWSRVTLAFPAPPEGRVRIAPFFVGYGKGRGTVWFDDLALEPIDPTNVPIVITKQPLRDAKISPLQYGQFIEYLCTLVPAMWAEKLSDNSFEGLSLYKFAHLKETDFRERPWYPAGATNRATFTRDQKDKVDGESSYRIAAEEPVPCTVGIAQDGIAVTAGMACDLRLWLKQRGLNGPVRVRLHDEAIVLAENEFHPTEEWCEYHAKLVPSQTTPRATLTISFLGPATLWVDCASLMPADAIDGWRKDVVETVRAMKPGVIRFGGSALDDPNLGEFDWKRTVGPVEKRTPFRAWGGLQPSGAGLEEIVRFCRLVDAEPLICVRIRGKSPNDAAEEIQYFNGGVDTLMGGWRAQNGHPEPYHIKFWQVGNEQGGPEYEARLPEFCKAMKAADPTIDILASFPTAGVLDQAGTYLDFISPHHYDCANLAGCEADFDAIRHLIAEHSPGRSIKVGVTEWNTTAGDVGPRRARLWTLENALACSRYHNLMHRQCDLVTIANRSNLANSFCSGCIQTDNHRIYGTPTYHAQNSYANMAGDVPLTVESPLPSNVLPDLSATLTPDGAAVVLFAVNDGTEEIARPIDLSAFGSSGQEAEVWVLADSQKAGEPDVTNSFSDPERIAPRRSTFSASSSQFVYRFPPLSLTVLRWRTGGGPAK